MKSSQGVCCFRPLGVICLANSPKKKNWQQKHCILYNASNQGIERLEIYDNKEDSSSGAFSKIITLENCIKITHSSPNTITILTKSHTQQISAQSEAETLEWLAALQTVAFRGRDSNPISCDEDNDLYCSSGEGVFSVKLCTSEATTRCGLDPVKYLLLLTATAIDLRDINDNKLYATWPHRYIRRYGYRQGKFTFEAGRKCDTGEGIFHLEHTNPPEIFKCLSLKMKTMKQMIGNDNLNSPEQHTEFNIHSSINLVPGSRTPLVATRPDDLNLSSLSFKTASVSSHQTCSTDRDTAPLLMPKPALKPKPQKPPRKVIIHKGISKDVHSSTDESIDFGRYKKLENYEPIERVGAHSRDSSPQSVPYDKVEIRNEAWKTLGIDDPDHTEYTPNLSDNPNCIKLISRSQDNLATGPNSSTFILLPSPAVDPEDENYDRLQHFGSTSKLNKSAKYKKIEARPTTLSLSELKVKDTWNDYDEVENVMQTARMADDSHLGYGMIRKPNTPGPQVPTAAQAQVLQNQVGLEEINHNNCNGTDYAIISRPKRV